MTGNRFPLMNSRQTKRRGLKLNEVDRYGNPIDPTEVKAKEDSKVALEDAIDDNLRIYMKSMREDKDVENEKRPIFEE